MSPELFDFIDEISSKIESHDFGYSDDVSLESDGITFCESFFDQFFGLLGHSISGFGYKARKIVGDMIEGLRADTSVESRLKRAVMAEFEAFCDIQDQIRGSGYGGKPLENSEFLEFLEGFLDSVKDWAPHSGNQVVKDRIVAAERRFSNAMGAPHAR